MTDIMNILSAAEKLNCKIVLNEVLKNYTTFRVGGACRALIEINSTDACLELLKLANENNVPYLVMGKGSNLIIDDLGFNGIVFHMGGDFDEISLTEIDTIECTAGTSLSKLCLFALENSLEGLEFAWGIPGSVGGAVYMNAGAYGGEMSDVILTAECVDCHGNRYIIGKDEMDLSYRHSAFMENNLIIAKASFKLQKGEKSVIRSKMDNLMERRKDKQPLEFHSAGSTFKRPEGSYASLLIEQCGLKGMSVGGAEVSVKHSGFVINKDNATFSDIMELIGQIKKIVFEKTGYKLECEPKIISFD